MRSTEKLNRVGFKITAPRVEVLEIFHTVDRRHLTAEDVHRQMVKNGSEIGLATVYRVLGQLTDVGILTRNIFESGKAIYELKQDDPHDHLICVSCGRVDEFSDNVIEQRRRSVAKSSGYELTQHQLVLYGYCPKCAARSRKKRAK